MKGTGFRNISEWTDVLKNGSGTQLKALASDPDALAIINDEIEEDEDDGHDVLLVEWSIRNCCAPWCTKYIAKLPGILIPQDALRELKYCVYATELMECFMAQGARFQHPNDLFCVLSRVERSPRRMTDMDRIVFLHKHLWSMIPIHQAKRYAYIMGLALREKNAVAAAVAILSMKRKWPDKGLKDVWPLIARHLLQPPLRRIDPRWKMIGRSRSGWMHILLTVLERLLLVCLSLMLLSHWMKN